LWWNKVQNALRFKGVQHQRFQRRWGEVRKLARVARVESFESRFVQAARRRLDPALFRALSEEASDFSKGV